MHVSLAPEPLFFIGNFPVTNSYLVSLIVTILLIIFAFWSSTKIKKTPSRMQAAVEAIFGYLLDLTESVGGANARQFLPLVMTAFIFILLNNWLGLFPGFGSIGFHVIEEGQQKFIPLFRGATADLNTTLALALISVSASQYYGLKNLGIGYLKRFFNFSSPISFFTGILELISEFAKIISFSFRLFGNVFAGEVLLAVVASLAPLLAPFPFFGLEIFVGLIQAFVFSILTLVFVNMATIAHGEEVDHGPGVG